MEVFRAIALFIGVFLSIIGAAMFIMQQKKEGRCDKAFDAVVKENAVVKYKAGAPGLYHPVFEYTDGRKKASYRSAYGYTAPKFRRGQKVHLHFNSANKNEYYVEEEKSFRYMGLTVLAIGLICLAAGCLAPTLFGK